MTKTCKNCGIPEHLHFTSSCKKFEAEDEIQPNPLKDEDIPKELKERYKNLEKPQNHTPLEAKSNKKLSAGSPEAKGSGDTSNRGHTSSGSDFDLSEKIEWWSRKDELGFVRVESIKTFIKKLKEEIGTTEITSPNRQAGKTYNAIKIFHLAIIDKLCGEKLR